ncbi:hypothetical protein G7054_g10003 [Neopestalotiopsis clavispora]|nr:hypothetical protein E8E14_008255 [Neopestalotiopsis sp. 37M]KAF7528947.1 hypothetical protein G7054_g10003 [Neopestalotiopsis clavispora]
MSFDQTVEEVLGVSSQNVSTTAEVCDNVGEGLPDIAGIGVMVSFAGQSLLSLVITLWVFFLARHGHLDLDEAGSTAEYRRRTKRLEILSSMLRVGNDMQMLLGIAYMITVWTKQDNIGVYHLRLAFDTVSFVGVSGIVAFVWTRFCEAKLCLPPHRLSFQYLTTYLYAIFFFALTVVTLNHMLQWNPRTEEPGYCYNTAGSADPGAEQPGTEIMYVVVTGFSLLCTMIGAIFSGPRLRFPLVLFAIMHYVVHLYFMIVVREANQKLLEGSEREDRWDFGQSTAMLLLGLAFLEAIKKAVKYCQINMMSDDRILGEDKIGQFDY